MTEDEACSAVRGLVGGAAYDRLALLVELVTAENDIQNLVARSTLPGIWSRHVLDSVQLLPLGRAGLWMDIGTGGGFPGLAIAAAEPDRPIMLIEPRKLRADFLRRVAAALELDAVEVRQSKVERVTATAATISARAVASTSALLSAARHCADVDTRWLLFRGSVAGSDDLAQTGMMFHVKQSLTDLTSSIAVMTGKPR